ncbi:hypothetical protein GCM10014715_72620 [Streptomyces spiralis]|uniref:Uncharacterized protein n=2 Tax=Streptomyces spiralis TaxID=66376 RepID=A0A919AGH8_9ACTN|nr:hypothetical protein GCM10014715_72620 [Streptomyces spiralis]
MVAAMLEEGLPYEGRSGGTDRKTLTNARDALALAVAEEEDDDQVLREGSADRPLVVRFQAGRYDRASVRAAVRARFV